MPVLIIALAVGGLLTGAAGLITFDRWTARAAIPVTAGLLAVGLGLVGAAVWLAIVATGVRLT